MKCREVEEQFVDFLEKRISQPLRRRIKAHLRWCKKCQGRLHRPEEGEVVPAVNYGIADRPGDPVSSLADSLPAKPEPAPGIPSEVSFHAPATYFQWMPVLGVLAALVLFGGVSYFLKQESADTQANGPRDPESIHLVDAVSPAAGASSGGNDAKPETPTVFSSSPEPTGEAEAAPLVKKAGNGKPHDLLPQKGGNGRGHDLSGDARGKMPPKTPPKFKLRLVSRDLKEAVEAVQSQASAAEGEILEKKEDDLEARFVLLLPASRYETFFQSLQQLGVARETSKKSPPAEDPVKLEVMIE